jgi:hypothetical protein
MNPLCGFQYCVSLLDGTDVQNCKQQDGYVYAVLHFMGRQLAGQAMPYHYCLG